MKEKKYNTNVRIGRGYPLLNKGFTLIELLAVIVILAILAVIAVPIVLNIVNDSKKSTVLTSGKNYLRAVEQAIIDKNLDGKYNPKLCIIQSDGNLMCDGEELIVSTTGHRPSEGELEITNKVPSRVSGMILDGYILEMVENQELVNLGRIEDYKPQGTYLMINPYVSSADTTFLGGDINRSTVESITIKNTKVVPSNAITSWDVSAAKDGSVIAWYTDTDNNNLYELYIGGDGGVKANPDSSGFFRSFNNVTTMDLKYLDTSDVTKMSSMFIACSSLSNLNVSNFDTSRVTDVNNMFNGCQNLKNLSLNNWNTSKMTNMAAMFSGCSSLTDLNISNFDTTQVTSMSYMFSDCSGLTNLNVSNFNTSKVTNMSAMFSGCNGLANLNVSNFDTSQVTNMSSMFSRCSNLTILDVSNFDTSKVVSMYDMFSMEDGTVAGTPIGNGKLQKIVFGKSFHTNQVKSMNGMFRNCINLTSLDLSSFDTSEVTNMSQMFYGCRSLTNLNLSNFNTSKVTNMSKMFAGCFTLTNINFGNNFNTSQVTDMSNMFNNCNSLTSIDLSSFNTNQVANMNQMFSRCSKLEALNLSNASFTSVINHAEMFKSNTVLANITVKDNDAKTFIEARLADSSKTGVTVTIAS